LTHTQRADLSAVAQTAKSMVTALGADDASVCTKLFTQHYVEFGTGLKGTTAITRCQQSVRAFKGTLKFVGIEGIKVRGATALVQFVTRNDGKLVRQISVLRRVRHGWRIDSALRPSGKRHQ
jgi:hypothetical protein